MQIEVDKKSDQPVISHSDSPIIDRYIIRKISGFITDLLVKTPITPNQVTIISLILGIVSAAFFSHGAHTYTIIAGVFYFVSTVFDQCDGEVARFKHMTSDFGKTFDIIVDSIVNATITIGITIAIYKTNGSGLTIIAGLLAMMGIVISLLLTTYFNNNESKNDTGAKEMLDKLNNKDFFYIIMLASVVFNQMIWFLLIMAIGTNIYWIVHKIAHRNVST